MNVASPQEDIRIGQLEIRSLLDGVDTHGAFALFEATIPPNTREPDSNHQA